MKNFALIGAAGFVAPRHMQAIRDTGNTLVAAVDPHDAVGVLDRHFPDCRFFTEIERFDRHLEKLRRRGEDNRVHFVSICSPNYLHDAHVRLALRVHATAICEKPLVLSPWNLDQLAELEREYGCRVFNTLQLRTHPDLILLKERLEQNPPQQKADVLLTYITRRGRWYDVSWKGIPEKSGGVAMNIGVHFFDLLMWLFGPVEENVVHVSEARRLAGAIELQHARVRWFLSVEAEDLPAGHLEQGKHAYRSMKMNDDEIEFSGGFTDLHTRVYQLALEGNGFGIDDARPSIELVHRIREAPAEPKRGEAHPLVERLQG